MAYVYGGVRSSSEILFNTNVLFYFGLKFWKIKFKKLKYPPPQDKTFLNTPLDIIFVVMKYSRNV